MAKNDDYYDYHTDYGGRIHSLYNSEDLGLGLIVIIVAVVLWNWWPVIAGCLLLLVVTRLISWPIEKRLKSIQQRKRQVLWTLGAVGAIISLCIVVILCGAMILGV